MVTVIVTVVDSSGNPVNNAGFSGANSVTPDGANVYTVTAQAGAQVTVSANGESGSFTAPGISNQAITVVLSSVALTGGGVGTSASFGVGGITTTIGNDLQTVGLSFFYNEYERFNGVDRASPGGQARFEIDWGDGSSTGWVTVNHWVANSPIVEQHVYTSPNTYIGSITVPGTRGAGIGIPIAGAVVSSGHGPPVVFPFTVVIPTQGAADNAVVGAFSGW